jgi:taurine dioxygenase
MLRIHPLPEALGAEILALDLSAPWDEALIGEVLAAFFANRVIVIRDQRLTPDRFAHFARYFGRPVPHILSHLRLADHPEILPLSNVFKDGAPIGVYDGAAYWHTDMSYEAEPGAATLVYSIETPAVGGETCFADMVGAYDDLAEAMKRRIEGLTVLHHYGNRADLVEDSRTSASPLKEEQKREVKNVFHPLVLAHPVTGRKALYGVAGSSFGIVGLPDDEAHALLDELMAHATQAKFVYRHRYAVGDLVVWDNFATLHAATLVPPATCPEDTRLLHRISVKGGPTVPVPAAVRGGT